jgi:heptosyltransferase I
MLRLSAIGDTCHVVPLVRTLQKAWPRTHITWIIGRTELRLMNIMRDVEFITVDKRAGFGALRQLRRDLAGRRFDVLLHMQLALRASVLSSLVSAERRVGFDHARARELQWLFTNTAIAPKTREHVLDSFFGFAAALGIHERILRWDLPIPEQDRAHAATVLPDAEPTLIISPCSSHTLRNWRPERYAAVAEHAVRHHGMRVVLCGAPTDTEQRMGEAIEAATRAPLINRIGQDSLPQLLALLERATVLLSPDSGPAHMATMVGTPVIGLYAATNPARTGPYLSRHWCVDRYQQAARHFRHREAAQLPWTEKIEEPGVMDLIETDAVIDRLEQMLAARTPDT